MSEGGEILDVGDPSQVICSGEGLSFGYIRHPITVLIDTTRAGSGELTVYCDGSETSALCEVTDNENGTYSLKIDAQEIGEHTLHIEYNGQDVTGSPFFLRVSPAGLVKMQGPGLNDGVLRKCKGEFLIDTHEAGTGEVNVKIGGPRGLFKLKTKRQGRNIVCTYSPKDAGIYIINVLWQGDHVPGSPVQICLTHTEQELIQYLRATSTA